METQFHEKNNCSESCKNQNVSCCTAKSSKHDVVSSHDLDSVVLQKRPFIINRLTNIETEKKTDPEEVAPKQNNEMFPHCFCPGQFHPYSCLFHHHATNLYLRKESSKNLSYCKNNFTFPPTLLFTRNFNNSESCKYIFQGCFFFDLSLKKRNVMRMG